jgi:hypothetical protein
LGIALASSIPKEYVVVTRAVGTTSTVANKEVVSAVASIATEPGLAANKGVVVTSVVAETST